MVINYSNYFKLKIENFGEDKAKLYFAFYEDIDNIDFRILLSIFHCEINNCFEEINERLESRYYHADNSRHFIDLLNSVDDVMETLKDTEFRFDYNELYKNIIDECRSFLSYYHGTQIPDTFERIHILEIRGIFEIGDVIVKEDGGNRTTLFIKQIGSGSYANVFKYKDTFYNKYFAVKRAKKGLLSKEYKRFHNEYVEMKRLFSPYVIEVFKFDEDKKEYYMEYADYTLDKYISKKNNSITVRERQKIIKQILKAFEYINSKKILHRDISTKNILLKKYDNLHVVKISDFGLVKVEESVLTSLDSEVKGYFNDPNLIVQGFKNYSLFHETYALTRIIYFVMTGKYVIEEKINDPFMDFIRKGLSKNETERYQNVKELDRAFSKIDFK